MYDLDVQSITRSYGAFNALHDVSFAIEQGTFVTLLGPSGCGKSTTLWIIAGLDEPSSGMIRFNNQALVDSSKGIFVQPEDRNFGLVFQSYALWPHMTMRDNLAFPLKLRGLPKKEIQDRIEEISALVELTTQLDKYPHQLSGGQQQRVALARTLIYRPRLLLLDEPLSNLDSKLRDRARLWLRALQKRLGITTIYVTHDQSEALAMSDRIIVMDSGRIAQDAAPDQVYRNPATPFVADFIGASNFLKGKVRKAAEGTTVILDDGTAINVPEQPHAEGAMVTVAIRPERIVVQRAGTTRATAEMTVLKGSVLSSSYLGSKYEIELDLGNQKLRAESQDPIEAGHIEITVPRNACMVFA